jgi:outer membrane protein
MRKIICGMVFMFMLVSAAEAQRFAYVDSEYILEQMPEYKAAQNELDVLAEQWSKEIEEKKIEIDRLYRALQAEQVLLTETMKKEREATIKQKEQEINEMQRKRFGYEGELFQKQKQLIKPVQDKVYDAVQKYARDKGYDMIFDRSGEFTMLYANSKLDKSDEVLEVMGVAKKAPANGPGNKSTTTPNRNWVISTHQNWWV